MRLIRNGTVMLLVLLLLACGRKGDPTPPVPTIPGQTTDLVVTQRGSNLILTWSFPSLSTAGTRLEKVSGISVYRYVETLPAAAAAPDAPAQQAGTSEPDVPREVQLFSMITPILPKQFEKLKERVADISGTEIPSFVVGSRVIFEDSPQLRTEDNRPVRVTYAVVSELDEVRSELSNLASIVPLQVPSAPARLTATAQAGGLLLDWDAPADAESIGLAGYNVYRFAPTGEIAELGKPLNATPVTETNYEDRPAYGEYRYAVTATRTAKAPLIESEPTATVLASFKDIVPPPVPANVVTLLEESAIRLLWDAVEAPDLAGYKVYRRPGGGVDVLLTPQPIREASFRDVPPERGPAYIYSVTSVDSTGNESAKAQAQPVTLSH